MRRIALIGLAAGAAATTATIAGLVAASGEPAQGDPAPTATLGPPPGLIPQINFPQFPSPPPNMTPIPDPPRTPTPRPLRPENVPSGSDLPRTPSVPADARTISLDEIGNGLQIGRILVRPPGSVPSKKDFARPSEGEVVKILLGRAESLQAQADALGVKLTHGTPPIGYQLASGRVVAWVRTATGETRISAEEYVFQSPTQYNLELYIDTLSSDGSMEVVAFAENTSRRNAHKTVEGIDVVYAHTRPNSSYPPNLQANFVLGGRAVHLDVTSLPMTQFEVYLHQFILEHRGPYEDSK